MSARWHYALYAIGNACCSLGVWFMRKGLRIGPSEPHDIGAGNI